MRTATTVEFGTDWRGRVDFVVEAERLGLDVCWVAEAWGADAVAPLGYLAARTSRLLLGSGVVQVGTRSPVAIAMAAMTLQHLSEGRFLLGLGSSGPQVLEGLHGVAFDRPLTRMRETIEIIRAACAGDKIDFHGALHDIPLAGARPMRLASDPVSVPIYVASLSPRMLQLTGALADGWLGTSFVPEGASAYLDPLRSGATSAGRELDRPRHLPGRRGRVRRGRGRTCAHGRLAEKGACVQPWRDGLGVDELLQRCLQPAGLGRRSPPRSVACGSLVVVRTQQRW